MKRNLLTSLFLLLLLLGTTAVYAQPAHQSNNLLQNPSFEQPYNADGAADKWSRWERISDPALKDAACLNGYHFRPKWNGETNAGLIQNGAASQHVGNNWDTWAAGVQQNVPVSAGKTYLFTFYARGRGTNDPLPAPSEGGLQINVRAGIDPNGGGAWNDSDVVWSAAGSPHDTWQQFSVQVTATADQITVFTAADWGVPGVNQCRQFLDVWFDNAQVTEAAPPATATNTPTAVPPTSAVPPTAVNTATPVPTNTPAATDTPVATPTNTPTNTPEPPKGGDICVNAFTDDNKNGIHDDNEGFMAGVTFQIGSNGQVLQQAVSPGNATPYCFTGLPAGTYQVAQVVPNRLEMTTANATNVTIAEGDRQGVEFGSRLRPSATTAAPLPTAANEQTTPAPTAVPTTTASGGSGSYVGLGVVMAGIVLLGVLLFFVLRRS